MQDALRNRSDLHAAELQKKRDKREPRLVKGEYPYFLVLIMPLV